jgi:hypothetical protein
MMKKKNLIFRKVIFSKHHSQFKFNKTIRRIIDGDINLLGNYIEYHFKLHFTTAEHQVPSALLKAVL